MSLQVWLPLAGDLHNQGLLGNTIITNHGATINNNGKIGQCYAFDNNSSYISIQNNQLFTILNGSTQPMSFCFWIYHADTTRAIIFGDYSVTGGNNFNIELTTGHVLRWYWGTPDLSISTMNVGLNTWTHVAFTYNGTTLKGYINGQEKYSNNVTLAAKNRASGEYQLGRDGRTGNTTLNGRLNDFRIYDHALSDKEVEEIAKGLVLHYKLDNSNIGNENLLLNSLTPTFGNGATGVVKSIENGIQKIVADNPNSNWVTFANHNTTLALAKGDSFTFSLMIKSPDSNKKPTVYFQNGMGYFSMQGTMSSDWSIIYYTGIWNIDNLATNIHLGFSSAPGTYYIQYFKLEKGTTYTSWAPNHNDQEWPEYGCDNNIVYDSSGYGNNGLIFNPLTITTDTLKYNVATVFDGNTSAIKVPYTNIASTDDIFTLNLWFKKDDLGSKNYETLFGGPSGFEMDTRAGAATSLTLYMTSTRGSNFAQFNFGEWYMVTLVNDGTNELYYVNTELKKTIEKKPMPAGNYYIGAWQTEIKQNYKGFISDFRIYKTALTADQILELYNTSATIDKEGNVYARELVEE